MRDIWFTPLHGVHTVDEVMDAVEGIDAAMTEIRAVIRKRAACKQLAHEQGSTVLYNANLSAEQEARARLHLLAGQKLKMINFLSGK